MIEQVAVVAVTTFARFVTGVRAEWRGCAPESCPRVYFANHSSHGDFVLIWSVLPPLLRRVTRPVAAADYWTANAQRRFLADRVFRSVLIERRAEKREDDPIAQMAATLDEGSSLILFPEGTRNTTDDKLLPFKSGLYRLAKARPRVDFVPVWIENLNRVMPKGELVPIPLLCTVTFGTPIRLGGHEDAAGFLERARLSLLSLEHTGAQWA